MFQGLIETVFLSISCYHNNVPNLGRGILHSGQCRLIYYKELFAEYAIQVIVT